MILVVLQHVSIFSFDINGYETVLNTALISFRMPLFFSSVDFCIQSH